MARIQLGNTPLLWACVNRHAKLVQMLIQARVDVNAKNHVCVGCLLRVLSAHGQPCARAVQKGETSLMKAAEKGHYYVNQPRLLAVFVTGWLACAQTAELLITSGADINAQDDTKGDTALHFAAGAGSDLVVECLLGSSAKVNQKNHVRRAPAACTLDN